MPHNTRKIDLVTIFDAILTSRQTCEKLQCLYEKLMSNHFRKTRQGLYMKALRKLYRFDILAPVVQKTDGWRSDLVLILNQTSFFGGGGWGGFLNLLQEVFKQGFWKIFVMRYLVDFMFVPRPEVSLVPRVALWSGLWFERHEFYYWTEFDCQLLKLFKLTFDVMLYYLHQSVKTNYKDLLSNFHRSSYCWHVQPCSFNLVINRKCTENSCKQQAQTCWSCVASAFFF